MTWIFLAVTAVAAVAFVAGFSLQDPKAVRNAFMGGAVLCLIMGMIKTEGFSEGLSRAVFLFVLLFFFPFSLGISIRKRLKR